MDALREVPVHWTGGVKQLLESKEAKQNWGECQWFNNDDCEPTSVLDLGSRLSPPLECTCPNIGFSISSSDSHPNPFCSHAHICWGSCHCPGTLREMGAFNDSENEFEGYLMEKEEVFPIGASASCSSGPKLSSWMEDYVEVLGNGREIDVMWTEQELGLMKQSTIMSSRGIYGSSRSAIPYSAQPDDPYSFISTYGDSYQQNYMSYEKAMRSFAPAGARTTDMELDIPVMRSFPLETDATASLYGGSSDDDDLVNSFINMDSAEFCEESTGATPLNWEKCDIVESPDSNSNRCDHHKDSHLSGTDCRDRDGSSTISTCSDTNQLSCSIGSTSDSSFHTSCEDAQLQMSKLTNSPSEGQLAQQLMPNGDLCTHVDQCIAANDDRQDQEMTSAHDGLRLVHLLLACAEAVACRDTPLAASLLEQLKVSAHVSGDSMQRVTCCFAEGLAARLSSMSGTATRPEFRTPTKAEKMEGLQLLYQCCPYIAFGFFAANEAILQAFEGKKQVHILDLGMVQNLQWPALIRALAARAEGPPQLRITAMGASFHELNEWGKELSDFALSLKVPFQFTAAAETLESSVLTSSVLRLRDGETLAINSMLQLHRIVKESRGSLKNVLQSLHKLSPSVITVVEQDANHNGPFFLGRFLEALYFYSAIFDSLEASLPRQSQQRLKVERFYFAEEIKNIVACEGLERVERHERADQWRRQLSRSGFQAVPLKFMSQARMMLSLYSCDGYTLGEEKGCLLLGWKGKPIMLASAWKPCQSTPQ